MKNMIHDSYSRDETVIAGSDRSFGIVMAVAFALIVVKPRSLASRKKRLPSTISPTMVLRSEKS